MKIDDLNISIIRHLREGRKSYKVIAEDLGVSENTVRSRVSKLEEEGVLEISGLVEVVDKPMYATAVGLVLYGARRGKKQKKFRIRDVNIFNRVMVRMKKWFNDVV